MFDDADALAFLEALLHPLVSREYLIWREQLAALDDPPRVCVTEVPLLYESGGETRFDRVVVVTAPRQLREQRRHASAGQPRRRLLDDAEKVARADYHYVNTGTSEDLDALGRRPHGRADERRIVRRIVTVLAAIAVVVGSAASLGCGRPDFVIASATRCGTSRSCGATRRTTTSTRRFSPP